MKLPLHLKLKKKAHQEIAAAQDMIIEEVYNFFPETVFHGGTAIWRCYQGNRFSEDIDVYLKRNEKLDDFFQSLQRKGFRIIKKRLKENSLYSLLELNRTEVRFEATFHYKKGGILREYELIDGNLFTVFTLSPEKLLDEKIAALLKRKKIRDLYDIFFLLRHVKEYRNNDLKSVLDVKVIDEELLPVLVLSGPIPTEKQMKEYINRWVR